MIQFEKEICEYLKIPSIPKRKWDGKSSFLSGCAVLRNSDTHCSFGVASFDSDNDMRPRITKVFTMEQYTDIVDIYVVPSYMDTNVDEMDLDDDSKDAAKLLVAEASELGVDELDFTNNSEPTNEYFFNNIHNDDEAIAFIKAHNKKRSGKGKGKKGNNIPKSHEGIILKLSVIYNELNKQNNNGKEKAN